MSSALNSDAVPDLPIGTTVRVIGGKYNGFEGTLLKACDTVGSIAVSFEGKSHELIVELAHLQSLTAWRATKASTELTLRGHAS